MIPGYLGGGGYAAGVGFGCAVRHSAVQSIPNNTLTLLAFDTEEYDAYGMHPADNNTQIFAPYAGILMVRANVIWAASASGTKRAVEIWKNGSLTANLIEEPTNSASYTAQAISALVEVSSGDYFQIYVMQDSGGALNVLADGPYSPRFSGMLVRT